MITRVAKGTDPQFRSKVHLAIGVEDRVAVLVVAADRFVG